MARWSRYAGRKASSLRPSARVRVYERDDVPGRIFISRAWETTESGRPEEKPLEVGTDREEAWILCQQASLEREKQILFGRVGPERGPTRLTGLLNQYHGSTRAKNWSAGHARNQKKRKLFWLDTLGADQVIEKLTTAKVEQLAAAAAERNDWSAGTERHYLAYLGSAVRWGLTKARLYDVDPLMGLETPSPRPDTRDRIYSLAEIRKLVTPHEAVDWRVTLGCSIAYDTGRRLSAFRKLTAGDLQVIAIDGVERLALVFQGAHDKAGRTSLVPVHARTAKLIALALERREVQVAGYLFPGGQEWRTSIYWMQPIRHDSLIELLHAAEKTLEIPRVKHRGFHGIKRLHVTVGMQEGDVELVRDTTGNVDAEVLRRIYRQQDIGRVTSQVDRLGKRLEE